MQVFRIVMALILFNRIKPKVLKEEWISLY